MRYQLLLLIYDHGRDSSRHEDGPFGCSCAQDRGARPSGRPCQKQKAFTVRTTETTGCCRSRSFVSVHRYINNLFLPLIVLLVADEVGHRVMPVMHRNHGLFVGISSSTNNYRNVHNHHDGSLKVLGQIIARADQSIIFLYSSSFGVGVDWVPSWRFLDFFGRRLGRE
jgi:hypothetical protein